MAPLPPPTMAAVDALWCGATNGGVVSTASRRRPPARAATASRGPRGPASRSSRGSTVTSRSASIVLPTPGGPHEEEMVPAGRGELEGQPGLRLPDDVGEVLAAGAARRWPRSRTGSGTSGSRPPLARRSARRRRSGRPRHARGRRGRARASAAFPSGTTTSRTPWRSAASTLGSTPRTGRTDPSRPSSPRCTTVRGRLGGQDPRRHERRDGDRQVEAVPALGIEAGERLTVMRRCGSGTPLLVAARLDPVGRLRAGGVGQPADGEVRQPLGDVRLDVDEGAVEPAQGDRPGAPQAHHDPTPTRAGATAGAAVRAQDPDDVDAHRPRAPQVVLGQPGGGEPSQARGLGGSPPRPARRTRWSGAS